MRQVGLLLALTVAFVTLVAGATLAIAPRRLERLRGIWLRRWTTLEGTEEPRLGARWETSIAGLVLAGGGGFFVYLLLMALTSAERQRVATQITEAAERGVGPVVHAVAVAILTLGGGLYLNLRTDAFLQWSFKKWVPRRTLREEALPVLRRRCRLLGLLFILMGIATIASLVHGRQ